MSTPSPLRVRTPLSTQSQAAPVICDKWGRTYIQDSTFRVQNTIWGGAAQQCIDVDQGGGFTVTVAEHNKPTNGDPAGQYN